MHQPEPHSQSYPALLSEIAQGRTKIPQFQRDFVWPIDKSAALIDSILRGYPIGTFIFWRTKERLRSVRDIGGDMLPHTPSGEFVNYVLDGQQRLTSLYAAIRGLRIVRDGGTEDFSEIRVDLAAGPDEGWACVGVPDGRPTVRVCDLAGDDLTVLFELDPPYRERAAKLRSQLQGYQFSSILVKDQPLDVATEIFTRINEGGKPLTPFEIMVAKTFDAERDFDLAQRCDALREELEEKCKFETIPEMVFLQVVAVLLRQDCRKKTILSLDRAAFIDAWPTAVDAVRRTVDYFRSAYGIPVSRLLPYAQLTIPFAYFFHQHKARPTGEMAERLRDLFWRTALTEAYSGATETEIAADIRRVDEILNGKHPRYDEPLDISADFVWDKGTFSTSKAFCRAILCLFASKRPRSFDDGFEVVLDNDWLIQANSKNYHHFFPKAYCRKQGWDSWQVNHVANITIIDAHLNKATIRDKPPATYMRKFEKVNDALPRTMKTHLIDLNRGVWDNDYREFVDARCEWIARELGKLILPQPIDEKTKPRGS